VLGEVEVGSESRASSDGLHEIGGCVYVCVSVCVEMGRTWEGRGRDLVEVGRGRGRGI